MTSDFKKILILCKAYPSPNPRYVETLSSAWLKMQGLVSVKDLWCKAQGYAT